MDNTSQRETLIELRHIHKIYYLGGEEVRANDDISLKIDRGEFVAIVGKSGSGKSTLMNIIGALDVPTDGEYLLGGEDVGIMDDKQLARIRNKMIGFIFQQYNLLPKLNICLLYTSQPHQRKGIPARRRLQERSPYRGTGRRCVPGFHHAVPCHYQLRIQDNGAEFPQFCARLY